MIIKIKKITFMYFFLALFFSFNTVFAAGIYSVDINNVDKKTVINYMVNDMISRGLSVITVNDYQVVMRKDVDDFMLRVFYGSRYNTTPEARLFFNLAQINNVVKVTGEARIVTNPNSAYEKSQIVDNNEMQKMLERLKASVEQQYATNKKQPQNNNAKNNSIDLSIDNGQALGFNYAVGITPDYIYVSSITPDSSMDKAGIQNGDRILKVNNIDVSNIEMVNNAFKVPKGTHIQLTINSGSELKNIDIEKCND